MAEQGGQSQEKTEDATPRRVREARKKGQVAKSRDLNTIVILIVACGALLLLFQNIGEQFLTSFRQMFLIVEQTTIDDRELFRHIQAASVLFLKAILPYMAIVLIAALFIGFIQIGPIFSTESITMQAKRLNIVENVKNMAKITTLIELFKNIGKIVAVFLIGYLAVKKRIGTILQTMTAGPEQGMAVAWDVMQAFLFWVFIVFITFAIIDVFVQRRQWKKQLRMSKDEVKREYKQDEGDPLIKQTRRQLHQEMAMSDTKQAVGASDVVVTNPTELAVAIKYQDRDMAAPQIMAKGQRLFAQTIREMAEEQGIPIMRNVPLAWALIELEVGDEVPEELYHAVAEVLLIVYRLRDEQKPVT